MPSDVVSTIFAPMLLAPDFQNLLVHPVEKSSLKFDEEKFILRGGKGLDEFSIKEGVPILLVPETRTKIAGDVVQSDQGGHFSYKEHYQTDAEVYDYTELSENRIERGETLRLRDAILSKVPKKSEWILDVGCGGAWLAGHLVPKGKKVVSMDISDVNPIRAIKKIPGENHFGLVADVFDLPFAHNTIDTIVASEIIEHVPDPKAFLKAHYEVLKPGGTLIVTTPYNELIRTSLCIHCNRLTPHNAHLHSFKEDTLKAISPVPSIRIETRVFNSKILVKTGIERLLSFLPQSIWSVFDHLVTNLTGKRAYRLMAIIKKPS